MPYYTEPFEDAEPVEHPIMVGAMAGLGIIMSFIVASFVLAVVVATAPVWLVILVIWLLIAK